MSRTWLVLVVLWLAVAASSACAAVFPWWRHAIYRGQVPMALAAGWILRALWAGRRGRA